MCVEHGVDAIMVSNTATCHGTLRATVERCPKSWPKLATHACVRRRRLRRGTDVFKALALGAKLWDRTSLSVGLGAFGQAGVDRVIEIMRAN